MYTRCIYSTGDRDIISLLVDHICNIRRQPQLKHAPIVIIPEANMSFIATDRMSTIVESLRLEDVTVVRYMRPDGKVDDRGRYGVVTTEARKILYVNEVRTLLDASRLKFVALEDMIGKNVEVDKATLGEQLKAYKEEIIPGDEYGTRAPKRRYSGKGTGMRDDLCLALQIGVYWSYVYKIW
jgi:hypothetical protein